MKKLLTLAAFAFTPLLLTGCGQSNEEKNTPSVAVINEAHGYADIYTLERFEELQSSGKRFAVFLGADWCPGCVRLTKEIHANQKYLPKDTVILTANFDEDIELRRDYAAPVKHTGIYFDKNGNHLKTQPNVLMQDLVAHLSGLTP